MELFNKFLVEIQNLVRELDSFLGIDSGQHFFPVIANVYAYCL